MNDRIRKWLLDKTLKQERQKASYSTAKAFNEEEVRELRVKAIAFTNKVKMILES
jgi:uncharacterized protein (UPF0332 family)